VFTKQFLYAAYIRTSLGKAMGNTYKDLQSRKVYKNLKANLKAQNFTNYDDDNNNDNDNRVVSFASQHQNYAKKKRSEYTSVDTVGSRYGNQRKMRSAQDIRARRAERHNLNSNLDLDPPSKPASPAKVRGVKWSG